MKVDDILNNADPEELRNILRRLLLSQDAISRPPSNLIIVQAPENYSPTPVDMSGKLDISGHIADRVMISDAVGDVVPDDGSADVNANVSQRGLLIQATAPSANELNVVGIGNGETEYSNKDLFNTTTPVQVGTGAAGTGIQASRSDHVHGVPKLDDNATPDDNTDLNATTSAHGLLLKATAPAANELNVIGIGNGETEYSNKDLFNTTTPAQVGTGAAGAGVQASRSDHVHGVPKLDDNATPDDNTDLNASTTRHGLLVKAAAPSAGLRNILAIDNAETIWKAAALLDNTNPAAIGTTSPGSQLVAARRDHVHAGSHLNLSNVGTFTHTNIDDHISGNAHGQVVHFHNLGGTIPASTTYYAIPGVPALTSTFTGSYQPKGGYVKRLMFRTLTSQPASGSLVATIRINNVASAVTVTVSAGGAANLYSDLVNSQIFSAADYITVYFVNNATGVSATIYSIAFEIVWY